MKKNWELHKAIFESGMSQGDVAIKAKVPTAYLSRAVSGRLLLDEAHVKRIAKVLKKTPAELGLPVEQGADDDAKRN